MTILENYACGQWLKGSGKPALLHHAVTGEEIGQSSSEGIPFKAMVEFARQHGGPALRAMTFHERAELLKKMAGVLGERLEDFYSAAATYGATKIDAWMDVEGGIGTLGVYASLGRKKLPNSTFFTEDDVIGLSKEGSFGGRHLCVPLEGVAVQINAYNFPSWGMLEKLGPSILAGMPSIVKPATVSSLLTYKMVKALIDSGVMPQGSLQLICGSIGDLLDHLDCQDVVSFTGSAATGQKLKAHPNLIRHAVRFNMEADSLNCIVLGEDVETGSGTFQKFIREIVNEMTSKAGQKCTAIRRIMVPAARVSAVTEALQEKLSKIRVGNPKVEGVRMGPLVSLAAVDSARTGIKALQKEAEILFGDPHRMDFEQADGKKGAFMAPILLHCKNPQSAKSVHELEVFGPVSTVMGYQGWQQAVEFARRGGGSLVASVYSEDESFIDRMTFGLAPYHGRLLVMNEKAAAESTGHGVAMPQLVHGGPGRAGGGEELGGLRSVFHYMQRVALQGSPERLNRICDKGKV